MQYLNLENVSRSYGEKVLFSNVNLSISKGDKIALVAKNGSGKSTLLRLIAGKEGSDGENAKVHPVFSIPGILDKVMEIGCG